MREKASFENRIDYRPSFIIIVLLLPRLSFTVFCENDRFLESFLVSFLILELFFGICKKQMDTWNSRRSAILSTKAICASSQPLASATGIKILEQGGTAADAAVAMAAVLNLTEPCSTGIGGDAFALYYEANSKKVHCLQGNGASSADLTLEFLNSHGMGIGEGLQPWNCRSGLCVTVPGAAALWEDILSRHGRMRLEQVLQPAISLAENGFPISPVTAEDWNRGFLQGEEAHRVLKPGNNPVSPGQLFKNPDIANTFRRLSSLGAKNGFYSGPTAEAIIAAIKEIGGIMTLDDLQNHSTVFDSPISTVYKGVRVYQTPPPSHGLCVLLALNLIQEYEKINGKALTEMNSQQSLDFHQPNWELRANPEAVHVAIESLRRAFADGLEYIGDPLHPSSPVPVDILLSEKYTKERVKEISPTQATPVKAGNISFYQQGETVYFNVIDSEGNACSFINSNYMGFGTGMMPKGTGFTLQNRGFNFSLVKGHPNAVGPRKRPYHTIIPSLATYENDGSLFGVFGNMVRRMKTLPFVFLRLCLLFLLAVNLLSEIIFLCSQYFFISISHFLSFFHLKQGGFMQPMGHLQLIRNIIDHRLNPQQACDAPRWFIKGTGKTQSSSDMLESELQLEDGFGSERDVGKVAKQVNLVEELKKKGHKIDDSVCGSARIMYGKAQVILKDPVTGILWAGSGEENRIVYFSLFSFSFSSCVDPRSDGCAIPMI
jgi:gamma-glutamyltranspeptidase/glutathione hydrolase